VATIWILDDDPEQLDLLAFVLRRDGFDAAGFESGSSLLAALAERTPDLLILDLVLPGVGGLEILERVRAMPAMGAIPIIMLTASSQMADRYRSLAAGCDDFLTKPVDHLELVLRVKTRLRAATAPSGAPPAGAADGAGSPDPMLEVWPVVLDMRLHQVIVGERRARLTPSEFAVLRYLMERPGEPVSVETLLVAALDYPPRLGSPETVRNHLRNLRSKVESDPANPRLIVNVPRIGYMFTPGA